MPNYEQLQLFQAFHHRSLQFGLPNSLPNLMDAEWCPSLPEYTGCVFENDAARSALFGSCIGFYSAGRVYC